MPRVDLTVKPDTRKGRRSKRQRKPLSFDQGMRIFRRQVEKAGILQEVRRREYYEKPTTKKKRKKAAAVKREQKQQRANNHLGPYKHLW